MGNSLRTTFGTMCGGEASKEIAAADEDLDQRPVAKPKQKKEKKKKEKKNKKSKNGDLVEIKEEGESGSQERTDEKEKEAVKEEDKTQEPNTQADVEPSPVLTLKERASDHDLDSEKRDDIDDEDVSDVIEDHGDDLDENEIEDGGVDVKMNVELPRHQSSSSDADLEGDSTSEIEPKKFEHIHAVEAIKPESLLIKYADEIFDKSAQVYAPFVEANQEFKRAVLEFENSVEPDRVSPDFAKCWQLYNELQVQEKKRSGLNRTASKSQVDICDVNVNLQSIRATGLDLTETIKNVRPPLEQCLAEASKVDVIEYVKGQMVEGQQLGITSKFSAPGKYRRNMKQLKKAVKILTDVEDEVNEILELVDSHLGNRAPSPAAPVVMDDESAIVPTSKDDRIEELDDDIFTKLDNDTNPSTDGNVENVDKATQPPSTTLLGPATESVTILEKAKDARDPQQKPDSPSSIHKSYIIEKIPEHTSVIKNSAPNGVSPLAKSVLDPRPKSPVTQVVVEEEDHNTLDYGKYVFIDPSTGDIQVMRNRSRSLDSLVSMTSNRSSISRFGSFEFVTDYEINIAEKNQSQMV